MNLPQMNINGGSTNGSQNGAPPSSQNSQNNSNQAAVTIINQIPVLPTQIQVLGNQPVPPAPAPVNQSSRADREKIYQWIIELASPESRETSLLELRFFLLFLTLIGIYIHNLINSVLNY